MRLRRSGLNNCAFRYSDDLSDLYSVFIDQDNCKEV